MKEEAFYEKKKKKTDLLYSRKGKPKWKPFLQRLNVSITITNREGSA